jgi:hypothetical protein
LPALEFDLWAQQLEERLESLVAFLCRDGKL